MKTRKPQTMPKQHDYFVIVAHEDGEIVAIMPFKDKENRKFALDCSVKLASLMGKQLFTVDRVPQHVPQTVLRKLK